ncbi:MAG: hypothetical protein ACK5OB_03290 [Pirellula sp.]
MLGRFKPFLGDSSLRIPCASRWVREAPDSQDRFVGDGQKAAWRVLRIPEDGSGSYRSV